jgi:hypothetical protein
MDYRHWMELNSLSLLIANTNGGRKGMLALDRDIAYATNISSNLTPKSPTQFCIIGAMVIVISLSCHVSYVHSEGHNNSMDGKINTQLSRW